MARLRGSDDEGGGWREERERMKARNGSEVNNLPG